MSLIVVTIMFEASISGKKEGFLNFNCRILWGVENSERIRGLVWRKSILEVVVRGYWWSQGWAKKNLGIFKLLAKET